MSINSPILHLTNLRKTYTVTDREGGLKSLQLRVGTIFTAECVKFAEKDKGFSALSVCLWQKKKMRFLALGDSYTIGESIPPTERWPVQLTALLRTEGINIDDPLIIATTGWTTDELSSGIDRANLQGIYDLVALLIGVNNQYRGGDSEEYRGQFAALLKRAIGFANRQPSRVIALSIPDWSVVPFAAGRDRAKIAAEIDRFNAINREEAERAGAHYLDVTPISRQAAADPDLIAGDGLHPSGKMYAEWARLALPVARKAIDS